MRRIHAIRGVAIALATIGLCLPEPLVAATTANALPPAVIDVSLGEGGVLLGQVVDQQGAALKGAPVSLYSGKREIAVTRSDDRGYFAFRGLPGGVYQLAAAGAYGTYRVWSPGAAPPAAQQAVLVVVESDTVRGRGADGDTPFLSHPLVIAAVVAGAVAIPVAITHSQHRGPASP